MKKLFKLVSWLIGVPLGVILIAFLVIVIVNWRDQAPSAAAQRFAQLYQNRPAVPDAENAYLYVMGFSSDPDKDPRIWGPKRIAWYKMQQTTHLYTDDPLEETPAQRPAELKALLEICKNVTPACLAALKQGNRTISNWLKTEPVRLTRYQTLLAYTQSLDTLPFDVSTPLPRYSSIMDGQRMLLLTAWQAAQQGQSKVVQTLLQADLTFWRQQFASSEILITKMVAVSAINRHFYWGNLILQQLPATAIGVAIPATWRQPLTPTERDMQRVLVGEWQFQSRAAHALKTDRTTEANWMSLENPPWTESLVFSRLGMLAFQPQATSNQAAADLSPLIPLSKVPYPQLPAALRKTQAFEGRNLNRHYTKLPIYNLSGEILYALSRGAYAPYISRVTDLEGARQAALLTVQLHSATLKPDAVPDYVRQSPLRNPYTQQPFVWDKHARTLTFVGLALDDELARHAYLY